ncbi:hypothetical protein GCM10027610_066020 [Dactylosporangium cerinum]
MELIVMVLAPFPLGFFVRQRVVAYLAYVGLHSFVFTFQTTTLLKAWVGGDTSGFTKDPTAVDWPYAIVNLVIYGAGLGLVALGHRLGERRRNRTPAAVDLAG